MSNDIMDLSARELAALIRNGNLSAVEAVRNALDRIEARQELNAFITVTADQALDAASEADRAARAGEPLGPLHGVPYSAKDLILTAGVRTTMGSFINRDLVPTEDAVAVARMRAAGAILIGKTTTPEYGHKQGADAPIFGRTLNPIDPRFTCGASSSGAAVAVATGMGPIALGTDGGGSIRIPASCCGIVGLKATLGVVANLQPPDLFGANSYVGPMARDVADTQLLFRVIQGVHRRDPYGQGQAAGLGAGKGEATGVRSTVGQGNKVGHRRPPPQSMKGLKVAWLPTCGNRLDPEVAATTLSAVRRMEQDGAIVEQVELDFVSLEPHFLVILESMLAARVGPHLERFRERLDPSLVRAVTLGREHSAVALQEASYARTRCFLQLQDLFEEYDVLASPTVSAPPLPVEQDPNGVVIIDGEPAGTIRGAWYPYTYPMNLTGHPALSMPCGGSALGLPIGLQLAGRWHDDEFLLGVAALLEERLQTAG